MHVRRGDLPRFLGDLASGALTGTPPHAYVALLQEDIESGEQSAATLAARHGLASFFVPVRVGSSSSGGDRHGRHEDELANPSSWPSWLS